MKHESKTVVYGFGDKSDAAGFMRDLSRMSVASELPPGGEHVVVLVGDEVEQKIVIACALVAGGVEVTGAKSEAIARWFVRKEVG